MKYLDKLFSLQDRVAVITGGSGILGFEMAKGLQKAGAKVVLLGTNEQKVRTKLRSLHKVNKNVNGMICNVLDEEAVESVNREILDKFGRIDILINAAGGHIPEAVIGADQSIFDLKIQDFKKVIDLNLHGTVLPTLIFGRAMGAQKSGSIINISSMASQRAITRVIGYASAKSAIEIFTKSMAIEVAKRYGEGIRVNAIAPGFFLTEQNKNILTTENGSYTKRAKTIISMTPFKRFGKPDELIGTIIWLAGDASNFVTGTIVPIDGGFGAFSGV